MITTLHSLIARASDYDGPDLKLFILVGNGALSSVAWSTGAQLMIFICFRFSVVLIARPGISICHATLLIDIKMTTSDKILGVHVDENLSWNDYYQHLRTKAVTVTDTESGKNHFILRLSQNYKYTIQIEKLFWSYRKGNNMKMVTARPG